MALTILCKVLPKKTLENAAIYVYEECQVHTIALIHMERETCCLKKSCDSSFLSCDHTLYICI